MFSRPGPKQKVESAVCYEDEARYLNLEKGSSVLVVHGMTYTDTFDLVESVKNRLQGRHHSAYWPSENYRISTRQKRHDPTF